METYHALHFEQAEALDTAGLRRHFLVEDLFAEGEIRAAYTHYDRMAVLGIVPVGKPLTFGADLAKVVGSTDFLARRELALVNVSAATAIVEADGESFELAPDEALYLGQNTGGVSFASADPMRPARLYGVSAPAHRRYPSRLVRKAEAMPQPMGSIETSNKRTIYKYIHPGLFPTCQLVVGMTRLEGGSVWNTMPAHTHDRRMEAYLYFEMPEDRLVVHLMGRPEQTRHLVVRNEQVVLSPPWSIHSGCGTGPYGFVWAMAGDNQDFADMDFTSMAALA